MYKRHIAAFATLLFAVAAAHAQSNNVCRGMTDQECIAQAQEAIKPCPFDNESDCAMHASVLRLTERYATGRYNNPDGTLDFDLMAKDEAAEKAALARAPKAKSRQQVRNDINEAQRALRTPYLDHYEPKQVCQPSQAMTQRDAWRQWAGVSSGPQGWDCTTVMVPVYR